MNLRPRPKRSIPLPYCAAWDRCDLGMSARFSGAVETGRRWMGRPEQARVWVNNTLSRTLLLGFDKANLVSTGRTTTGRLRPSRFRASVQPFLYDLSDSGQIRALEATWSHISAYAAGHKENPYSKLYYMKFGKDRELCRTEYNPGKYEVVVARCYNQNHHEPYNPRLFAWDPLIREAAWEEHYHLYPVVPGYGFTIHREAQDGDRVHVAQRGDRYEIPMSAVEPLVGQVDRCLRELWIYIQRHPSQVLNRYDAFPDDYWVTRWQLYDSQPFNEFVGPRLYKTFSFEPRPELFGGVTPRPSTVQVRVVEDPAPEPPKPNEAQRGALYRLSAYMVGAVKQLVCRWVKILVVPTTTVTTPTETIVYFLKPLEGTTQPPPPCARGPPENQAFGCRSPEGVYFFDFSGKSGWIGLS